MNRLGSINLNDNTILNVFFHFIVQLSNFMTISPMIQYSFISVNSILYFNRVQNFNHSAFSHRYHAVPTVIVLNEKVILVIKKTSS